MAGQSFGVTGVARKVPSQSFGAAGVDRKVKNGHFGVDGVARKFFGGETVTINGTGTSWGRTIPSGARIISATITLDVAWDAYSGTNYLGMATWAQTISVSEKTIPHTYSDFGQIADVKVVNADNDANYNGQIELTLSTTGLSGELAIEFDYNANTRRTYTTLEDASYVGVEWSVTYETP